MAVVGLDNHDASGRVASLEPIAAFGRIMHILTNCLIKSYVRCVRVVSGWLVAPFGERRAEYSEGYAHGVLAGEISGYATGKAETLAQFQGLLRDA